MLEQFGPRQGLMDSYDKWSRNKAPILAEAKRLTVVGALLEAVHLLLYIQIYTGTKYFFYTPASGGKQSLFSISFFSKSVLFNSETSVIHSVTYCEVPKSTPEIIPI